MVVDLNIFLRIQMPHITSISIKYSYELCGSRKYPYPHHRGSFEILAGLGGGGGGVLKAKIFRA